MGEIERERERERERESKILLWCIDKKPPVFQNVCHVIVNRLLSFNFYH